MLKVVLFILMRLHLIFHEAFEQHVFAQNRKNR